MNHRTLGLLLILITFASLTTAQIQNGAFTSSDGWSSFVDRLDSCKEDSVCTTSDSMGEQIVKNNELHLDSGTTGFCGEAGFRQVVSVPEDAQYLLVDAVATKDYWGGNHLGVQINGEFVKQFAVADQPKSETWGPDVFRVNASQYAGRVVNLSLVLGDDSREWCNMGDHGHSLTVDHIAFASSYQDARIEHVQVPETISAGTSFSATVVFTNTGTETFKGDVRLLDPGKFGATVDVEEQYSDGVAPGQTVNVTLNVKIPSDVQLDSTETLTAYVNRIWQGDGRYSFLDTQDVTVQTEDALPDSIETNFYPETVSPGETYNMTFETTRNGERVSATVNMSIYIDGELKESSTGELTDGLRSTSGAFPGPQDVSYFQEGSWKLVATTTGTSGAISDSDTFEVVTDTSGNTTGLAAEIVSIQAPSSVAVGGSFQVNVTVRNTGTEPYSGYIFFGDADGYYGNSRDIQDLIGSALEPGETVTVTLPAGVVRPSRVEKGHEPVPGEREKLAVELGLENSVDSLDRELYSVYVRNETTGSDGRIVNVSGIERPVSPGEPVYIDVVVKNTGSGALNGTLRAQHTMESLSADGMAASSRVKTRDIYLLEGVTNRHVIQFTTSETPGVHMIEFELAAGGETLDRRSVTFTTGEERPRIPDTINVGMTPHQLSPGERFNLTVQPLVNGSLMAGLSGHTQVYVNGELVYNESATLESTFGETFPGPNEFEGFAYGDWRIVVSSHGVSGSTSFEVVRKEQRTSSSVVLKPGWNMVSFRHPVRLGAITDDCRVDTFQGSRVWTFGDGWSHPRVMEPTRSYYLHASSRCVAHVEGGSGTASTSTTDSISLEEGWNMISLPGSMQASLSSISGSCDIRDYRGTPVWSYDPDLGWQQFGMSRPLKSTEGYFVNVASDCSLQLGTSTPPTPGDTGGEEEDVPLAGEWKYEQAATCKFRGKGSGYRCTSDAEFDANGGYWCECVNLTWVRYH